jgi:hypothetical protein
MRLTSRKLAALLAVGVAGTLVTAALLVTQSPVPRFVTSHEFSLVESHVNFEQLGTPMIGEVYVVKESFWKLVPEAEKEIGATVRQEKRRTWLPQAWYQLRAPTSDLQSVAFVPGQPYERLASYSTPALQARQRDASGWTTVTVYHRPNLRSRVRTWLDPLMTKWGLHNKNKRIYQTVAPEDMFPPPGIADFTVKP